MKKLLLFIAIAFMGIKAFAQPQITNPVFSNIAVTTASVSFSTASNCNNGANFEVQYSTDPTFATYTVWVSFYQNGNPGSNPRNFGVTLLSPGTTYYFRVSGTTNTCGNVNYTTNASSFTTLNSQTPIINNVGSFNLTYNSAQINYQLNAENSATTSVINYGTSATALNSQVTGSTANGVTPNDTNTVLNGLEDNTTYYYQVVATNASGSRSSTLGSFTTPIGPKPAISNITSTVTPTTGTINYTLNANGFATTSVINYGLSATSLTNQIVGGNASGTANTILNTLIFGLTNQTTYYYQIVATNSIGTRTSAIQSFLTFDPTFVAEYNFNNTYNNVSGSVPFGAANGVSFVNDRFGNANSALNMNNVGTQAAIANLPVGNSARTISIWVKSNMALGSNHIFNYGLGYNNEACGLTIQGGSLYFYGYSNDCVVPYSLNTNGWNHIVTTYRTNGLASIYVNGSLIGSATLSPWNTNALGTNFRLGQNVLDTSLFNGSVDDLKIFNVALNDNEVLNLYTAQNTQTNFPIIITSNISFISNTTSTLNYDLNANGFSTTSVINYGTTATNLNNQLTGGSATGNTYTPITTSLSGLVVGTTYYYQIVATNSFGTTTSGIKSFTIYDASALTTPIAQYRFTGNNAITDSSGNSNDLLAGSIVATSDRMNNPAAAAIFNGSNNTYTTSTQLRPTSISVAAWVYKTNSQSYSTIAGLRYNNASAPYNSYALFTGTAAVNKLNFGFTTAAANDNSLTSVATLNFNTWYHVVATYNSTTGIAKLYINGVEDNSQTFTASPIIYNSSVTQNFNIGRMNSIGAHGFIGKIDEVFVYGTAITPTQVNYLFTESYLSAQNFNTQNLKASIYPNPAKDILNIQTENEVKSIEIYSLLGQKIMTENQKQINVSSLTKGLYMVRIEDENNAVATQKLIIE